MKDKALPFLIGFALGHRGSSVLVHGVYLTIIALLLVARHWH